MNKRGISALLSAVLLIGFVVALGAVVSTFLIQQAEDFNPEALIENSLSCDSVAISPVVTNADNIGFTTINNRQATKGIGFKNKGTFSIEKLTITAPGFPSQEYFFFNDPDNPSISDRTTLAPGQENELRIFLQQQNDKEIIKATPWIKDRQQENQPLVICTKNEVQFDFKEIREKFQ